MTTLRSDPVEYSFTPVTACEMCNASHERFKTVGVRKAGHQGFRPRRLAALATPIQRCRRCNLVFSNPRPKPMSLGQHYNMAPEDYWGGNASRDSTGVFEREMNEFRSLWGGVSRPRALDVGVGLGKTMNALERAGFDVTGLEPSPSFARAARNTFDFAQRLIEVPVEEAAFPTGSFDLVTFGAVLEHLQEPGRVLERALNWLKPTGLVHVEVPSSAWLVSRLANLYYRGIGTDYTGHLSPMHPPFHLYEFSANSFRLHGDRIGYEIARITYHPCDSGFPVAMDIPLRFLMSATQTGMQMILWLRPTARGAT